MKSNLPHKVLLAIIGIVFLLPARSLIAEEYLWPMPGYQTLTGTFGEFRYNHFHAGIDISTKGVIGLPLSAIDNGYVSRIRTSPVGYGRAVYLTLEDGNIAVYGHLSKFGQQIERWVREKQLASGEFSLDTYPPPALFALKKGEVIGYSGDSGNVPAHLHFEIRKKENDPINPLNHLGPLPPGQAHLPIIALAVDPIGINSTVDETWETKTYEARWDERLHLYTIPQDIYVWGRCGIAVSAYDISRGYRMGLRKMQLFANDRLVSTIEHDSFSFREYRHNYRMVDRELFLAGKGTFQRLYQTSRNQLSFYSLTDGNDGILSTVNPSPSAQLKLGSNQIRITVESNGNQNQTLLFHLIGEHPFFHQDVTTPPPAANSAALPLENVNLQSRVRFFEDFVIIEVITDPAPPSPPQCSMHQSGQTERKIDLFPRSPKTYVGRYRLVPHADGLSYARIWFPSPTGERKESFHSFMVQTVSPENGGKALSDDSVVCVTVKPGDVDASVFPQVEKASVNPKPTYLEPLSLSYAFKPLAVTFSSPAEITFRYPPSTAAPHQCAVFYRDEGSYWRCLSSRNDPEQGTITAQVPFFATFALMRDAYPPVITHLFPQSGTSVRVHHTSYSARLSDKGTGIDYLKTYMKIDESKVPAEYVPKKGFLFFNAPKPLGSGAHSLEVGTSDLVGNTSVIVVTFKVETEEKRSPPTAGE